MQEGQQVQQQQQEQQNTGLFLSNQENLFNCSKSFSYSQQQQKEKDEKKDSSEEVKGALNSKREQYRVKLRRDLTEKKLSQKRLKYTEQLKKQYTNLEIESELQKLYTLLQQEQKNYQQIQDQLQLLRKISVQDNAPILMLKETKFLQTLHSLINPAFISSENPDSFLNNTQTSQNPQNNIEVNYQLKVNMVIEAIWTFANLAFFEGQFPYANQQFMSSLIDKLFGMIEGVKDISIIAICLHCLANIISENTQVRDYCIGKNILVMINGILETKQFNTEMLTTFGQIINGISSVCPPVSNYQAKLLLQIFLLMIDNITDDENLVYNLLKAFSSILSQFYQEEEIKSIIVSSQKLIYFIFQLTKTYGSHSILLSEISKLFVTLTYFQDDNLNIMLMGNDFLTISQVGINHKESKIRINFAMALANIACSQNKEIQNELCSHSIMGVIVNKLNIETFQVKKDFLQIITCLVRRATHENMQKLLALNVIQFFSKVIQDDDPQTLVYVLDCLRCLMNFGKEMEDQFKIENPVLKQIEDFQVHNQLEKLQYHEDDQVYELAYGFVSDFFDTQHTQNTFEQVGQQ